MFYRRIEDIGIEITEIRWKIVRFVQLAHGKNDSIKNNCDTFTGRLMCVRFVNIENENNGHIKKHCNTCTER